MPIELAAQWAYWDGKVDKDHGIVVITGFEGTVICNNPPGHYSKSPNETSSSCCIRRFDGIAWQIVLQVIVFEGYHFDSLKCLRWRQRLDYIPYLSKYNRVVSAWYSTHSPRSYSLSASLHPSIQKQYPKYFPYQSNPHFSVHSQGDTKRNHACRTLPTNPHTSSSY